MFIQTEETPNQQTLKFLPGQEISPDGSRDFPTPEDAETSLLARELYRVDGVTGVFAGADFVAVIHIKPAILGAIMDVIQSGKALFEDRTGEDHTEYEGEAAGIVKEIKELIDTRVRPAVAQDGGDRCQKDWNQRHQAPE